MITNLNKFKINEEEDNTEWNRVNTTSSMTFAYPPKPDSLTAKFVQFVFNNPGCTNKDFYESINRVYTPGNNSQFFAGINQAGIVELINGEYYIGPNYGKWTRGQLKMVPNKPYWKR